MSITEFEATERRARQAERPIVEALAAWMTALRDAAAFALVLEAVRTGVVGPLLAAVRAVPAPLIDLTEPAAEEGRAALRLVQGGRAQPQRVLLRFDIRDPFFERAVLNHRAALVRHIDDSTRDAVARTVAEAYRRGLHPYDFAPRIRDMVGLTTRQSFGVLSYAERLAKSDRPRDRVTRMTRAYANRAKRHRANMIARTETIRGLAIGKVEGYRQAAAAGLVDAETAKLVWDATNDSRVCPICRGLDGVESSLEEPDFNGYGLPPAHPQCRCTVQLDF